MAKSEGRRTGNNLTLEKAVTARVMRQINRSSILEFIRDGQSHSRTEIGRCLKMSLPTVMRIVDELIADDLVVVKKQHAESTGGRRAGLVEFNGPSHLVVSIDIGVRKMTASVVDLLGTIYKETEAPIVEQDPERSIGDLCSLIQRAVGTAKSTGKSIRGVAVGVPGIVQNPKGVVVFAPGLNWVNLPLVERLEDCCDYPIFIENDVNLDILGEMGFGAARNVQNAVCLAIGRGMGAGLIIDGALYRGHNQAAGEIGYIPPDAKELGQHSGGLGALVNMTSRMGVLQRVRRLLEAEGVAFEEAELSPEEIFRSAREGKFWAETVVHEIIEQLSFAMATVTAVLDPQLIILGGDVAASSADLLLERLARRLEGELPFMPQIVASPLGRRATACGAVMAVLYGTTTHFFVRSGLWPVK